MPALNLWKRKNEMKRLLCSILAALTMLLTSGCIRSDRPIEYSRIEPLMHTFVQVKASIPRAVGISRAELGKAVYGAMGEARALEKRFSAFYPGSEANLLNIVRTRKVSTELFGLLTEAGRISRLTDGEFDITVAPVLKAEGFYKHMPERIRDRIPESFDGVGWENVVMLDDGRTVTLRKGAWIDLSGIAKGYIVDRMAGLFKEKGITGVMVNAGGDIYCGAKDDGAPWKIGIRRPGARSVVVALDVKDMAVATSGDYENVVIDRRTGEGISHIIDPSRGEAVRELPSSVTVIAPACARADALATGMMAMGREKAMALADTMEDVSIIVVECAGRRPVVSFSKGAEKYLAGR